MPSLNQIADEILNVQVYPSRVRVEPNDKATKSVFRIPDRKYPALISGRRCNITEVRNHKKHGNVKSSFKLENSDGYDNESPLTEFDRAVLSVCISEWDAGNRYTTPAIILRGLTGKVGKSDAEPSKNQTDAILSSVRKLMFTEFDADVAEAFETLKYDGGKEFRIKRSAILPCVWVEATINGQTSDIIYFNGESPLLNLADAKCQIIRYDTELLDVPHQQNTPMNIALKNYVIRRVFEIEAHKMTATLTFDDIFKKCRISDASRDTKMNARNTVVKFFEHLQAKSIIRSPKVNKKGTGFYSISFAY